MVGKVLYNGRPVSKRNKRQVGFVLQVPRPPPPPPPPRGVWPARRGGPAQTFCSILSGTVVLFHPADTLKPHLVALQHGPNTVTLASCSLLTRVDLLQNV